MRHTATLLTLVSFLVGCQPAVDDPMADAERTEAVTETVPIQECDWRSTLTADDPPEAGASPPCDIQFREVVRLEGDLNGVIPDAPITVLADGTFLTATYVLGRLARWTPEGEFMHGLGNGPGDGPGEFNYATGLAQVESDEAIVFGGGRVMHWYSTDGDFLRSLRLPSYGGVAGAVVHEDAAIIDVTAADGLDGYALEGAEARPLGRIFGNFGRRRHAPVVLTAAEDIGVWSAVYDRYVLRRHVWPSGAIADSITLQRDWFPGPEGTEANLFNLHADGRGLIWVPLSVADPQAPGSLSSVAGQGNGVNFEDISKLLETYTDVVIEALTPEGALVASARFDSYSEAAEPISGNLWYRTSEDELSIIVLEALLVDRGR